MTSHPLWKDASQDELENASEGMEKYVMTKIYNKAFIVNEDDTELTNKINRLKFLTPKHLDIPAYYCRDTLFVLAQKELLKINSYKSPRDKLVCILNCCKVIYNLLNTIENKSPAGADEFLPILIYTVLRANPPTTLANIRYIQNFRNPEKMKYGETGYYFTHLVSAVTFLQNLDKANLSIDPDEFERLYAASTEDPAPSIFEINNIHKGVNIIPNVETIIDIASMSSISSSKSSDTESYSSKLASPNILLSPPTISPAPSPPPMSPQSVDSLLFSDKEITNSIASTMLKPQSPKSELIAPVVTVIPAPIVEHVPIITPASLTNSSTTTVTPTQLNHHISNNKNSKLLRVTSEALMTSGPDLKIDEEEPSNTTTTTEQDNEATPSGSKTSRIVYQFLQTSVQDLKIKDIPLLLDEYKQLVAENMAIRKDLKKKKRCY